MTVFAVFAVSRTKLSIFADREKDGAMTAPKILDGTAARRLATPEVLWRLAALFTVVCCFFYYCVYSSQHKGAALYRSLTSAEEQYVSQAQRNGFFQDGQRGRGRMVAAVSQPRRKQRLSRHVCL